ncbi:hypothetical protein [[Phormidium ambiguum] IAM M-71]|nr:hypothetical protein [Phormidium ambiguum]
MQEKDSGGSLGRVFVLDDFPFSATAGSVGFEAAPLHRLPVV